MRLKYIGGSTEGVEIPSLGIFVAHGEIIEVDDDVGKAMAETAEWQVTSRGSSKKGDDEE